MEFCKCGKLMKIIGIDMENYHIQYRCMWHEWDLQNTNKHELFIKTYTKREFDKLPIIKYIRKIEKKERDERIRGYLKKRSDELC
jgi:hypothetical protein